RSAVAPVVVVDLDEETNERAVAEHDTGAGSDHIVVRARWDEARHRGAAAIARDLNAQPWLRRPRSAEHRTHGALAVEVEPAPARTRRVVHGDERAFVMLD